MKTKIFLLWAVVIFVLTVAGCNDDGNSSKGNNELQEDDTLSYTLTKWKLVGFYDIETSTLIEAEPKDCESCYNLEIYFVLNSRDSSNYYIIRGTTIANHFDVFYDPSDTLKFHIMMTKVAYGTGNWGNVHLLYEALTMLNYPVIDEDILKQDTLKLHYNSYKNYLLYRKVE